MLTKYGITVMGCIATGTNILLTILAYLASETSLAVILLRRNAEYISDLLHVCLTCKYINLANYLRSCLLFFLQYCIVSCLLFFLQYCIVLSCICIVSVLSLYLYFQCISIVLPVARGHVLPAVLPACR